MGKLRAFVSPLVQCDYKSAAKENKTIKSAKNMHIQKYNQKK